MKKIIILLVSIITISLVAVSCNKDDNDNDLIDGKWIFSKVGYEGYTGGDMLTDYEHTAGCNKDYLVVTSGGQISFFSYEKEGSVCSESIDTGTWVKNGNTISISFGGVVFLEAEIINLTNSELKIRDIEDGYITVFTRG